MRWPAMFRPPALAVLILTAVTACAQFPDLDAALSPGAAGAAYPDLVPVEQLKAQMPRAETTFDADDPTAPRMAARIAALRARAASLRGTVIDSPTRARMEVGVPPIPSDDG